jgi:dihydroxyacid dehydratase/phosphogluconate dehydratase
MSKDPKGMRRNLTSYGDAGFSLYLRKAFIKAMGYTEDALERPEIGIANTFSGYNPCHANVPEIVEAIKRGVMLAGRATTPAVLAERLRLLLAVGGSTNAIAHLAAIAGRLGIAIDYQASDRMGRETPVLIDLKPSSAYYMEDL